MEKVIVTLRTGAADDEWAERIRGPVAEQLLGLGVPGLTVNVRDAAVRAALMTLTTLDPPVQAFVTLWTQQYYGDQVTAALDLLASHAEQVAAYLVTESAPMPPPPTPPGERAPALANMALLRRPADMDEPTWLTRWHGNHTQVAIDTQSTFGYVQNYVVRALTPGRTGDQRHRRGTVPRRGGGQPARILRRGRRRRPPPPDGADGRQHRGVRRQRQHRRRADKPLRLPHPVQGLTRW